MCCDAGVLSPDVTNILRTGRLIQQFQIDVYVKLETQCLDFLRNNQSMLEIRAESYQNLIDSMSIDGVTRTKSVGQRVFLPTSFTGVPRDLRKRYMNALALVMEYGRPDFFITMTCNPKWIEIQRELLSTEKSHNRADLYARAFRAKKQELKKEIVENNLFGEVAAYFYVIEFQKRGLPHVHWLIIMKPKYKITSTEAYDRFVSAEIPCPHANPHLHACVKNHMMHGPCGELNEKNVCMRGGKCKNFFPQAFKPQTEHKADSYPNYKRNNNGSRVFVRGQWLDNRWVVPYNAYLLAKFDCHINMQICSDVKSVKYLYKYVCKGNDKIAYKIVEESDAAKVDEIKNYQTSRWFCAPKAMWRIYGFDMCDMYPPVLQLYIHFPGYQQVYFKSGQSLSKVAESDRAKKTMLTEFFEMNKDTKVAALNLLYKDFPKFFVWNQTAKKWTPRTRSESVGRLVAVNMLDAERFYLRVLLNHVRAPTSFEDLRTSNGTLWSSY